jgi:ankyrin repeat protein
VRDHTQRTPLHYAAQWGQECILEYLIHCGADVNAQDFIMDTPLHFVSCIASSNNVVHSSKLHHLCIRCVQSCRIAVAALN